MRKDARHLPRILAHPGRALAAVSALGAAVAFAGGCSKPELPPLVTKDPQVGYLQTLGDEPLFRARLGTDVVDAADFFDTNGVRAPHVIERPRLPSDPPDKLRTLFMYYEGLDGTVGNVSAGIGEVTSDTEGVSFGSRRLLLVRRNRIAGDLTPLLPPIHPPPRQADSFDSRGVQHPMVLQLDCTNGCAPFSTATYPCESNANPADTEQCPYCVVGNADCRILFYSGPGIFGAAADDDTNGIGPEFITPPSPPNRAIPQVPSGIGIVPVPALNGVARNPRPLLLANKELDDGTAYPEDDNFYTTIVGSFNPVEEVCNRRSFNADEFLTTTAAQRNVPGALGIEAGPFPWESGGVSAPFVAEDPCRRGRYLLYYTCTEEFGENAGGSGTCAESYVNRICQAELGLDSNGNLTARRIIPETAGALDLTADTDYATPSDVFSFVPNNVVVGAGNFTNGFDVYGSSDPSILFSYSVLGHRIFRMWYTGMNENKSRAIGLTGSFGNQRVGVPSPGCGWNDWDADDPALRFSTLVPTNPIMVRAGRNAAPTALFGTDRILRVFYDTLTSGTEPAINLSSIVPLPDTVAPLIDFVSPTGTASSPPNALNMDQGCPVNFEIHFDDAGGSGVLEGSFLIQISGITRSDIPGSGSVKALYLETNQNVDISAADDWRNALDIPGFTFGVGDTAEVLMQFDQFRLNPPLPTGATALVDVRVDIFDRNSNPNASNKTIRLTLTEAGTTSAPTTCD